MEKLNFLADFGIQKERAWSGTTYSLYKALEKYFEITDVNISVLFAIKALFKILHIHWFNSSFYTDKLNRAKYKKLKGNVFQFSEIKFDDEKSKTFIYQDLTVSYIKFMKDHIPDVFRKSGYGGINEKILEKRLALQNKYYSTCSAIFTMGNWLKDFLVTQGIPAQKIFAVGGGYKCKDKFNKSTRENA